MNLFSNEATKQSCNNDKDSLKSASKILSNLSLTSRQDSVEKRIEDNTNNHKNYYQYNQNQLGTPIRNENLEQNKVKIQLFQNNSSSNNALQSILKEHDQSDQLLQKPSNGLFSYMPSSAELTPKESKKRKNDKLTKAHERDIHGITTTKKTKMTPNSKDMSIEARYLSDSSLGSLEIVPPSMSQSTKEHFLLGVNKGKITDFFSKTRELIEEASRSKESTQGSKTRGLFKGNQPYGIIPEEHEAWLEERNRLFKRIGELEGKLDFSKKEREREKVKYEETLEQCREEFERYKAQVQSTISKFILTIESYKRMERKTFLNQQKQRLGEYVTQR